MKKKIISKIKKIDPYLMGILILAAFLYGYKIWQAGYANQFYTAAIVSMSKSWKAFWYGSFDPASFITVDKPPVALWFMVLSVKIFGFHSWSIVLSSVLFGIGSVYLMYKLIKPYFGRLAANLGALFLTLTPIVVANSRTNNMDATLLFFLLLAGYYLQKSVLKKKPLLVLVSFALIGVAFNIKMLQAFMVLPAMYIFYFVASKYPLKKKLLWTIGASVSLVIFTLAWPLAVDSTSKNNRPYIGSSSTNSVLNLAFGYNGSQRLLGQSTGMGGAFPGMNNKKKMGPKGMKKPAGAKRMTKPAASKSMTKPSKGQMPGKMGKPNGMMGKKPSTFQKQMPQKGKMSKAKGMPTSKAPKMSAKRPGKPGNGGMGAGGGIFNVGKAGVFRLFQTALGQQVSWLLPLSLFGFVIAYLNEWRKKKQIFKFNQRQTHLIYWLFWLIPVYGFFSMAQFFHPYYMIMIAPPIAALAAIGISSFIEKKKTEQNEQDLEFSKTNSWLMGFGILTTACLQAWYVNEYYPWATYLLVISGILIFLALVIKKFKAKLKLVLALGMIAILLAPGFWSLTPTLSAESAAIPTSGPSLLINNKNQASFGNQSVDQKMLKYLEKHQGNAKYLFATMDSNTAAPYIIKTSKAVMTIGGYNGTDNAISLKKFKQLVKNGTVKYFYLTNDHGASSKIAQWVKKNGKKINLGQSNNKKQMGPMNTSGTLYYLTTK